MSLQIPISALSNETSVSYLDVTFNGSALDLTDYTPLVVKKASATVADSSGTTYTIGAGLSWVNQQLGKLKLTIPAADIPAAGSFWWRLDIVDATNAPYTVMYGAFTVKAV
jgi:hypothetical protein